MKNILENVALYYYSNLGLNMSLITSPALPDFTHNYQDKDIFSKILTVLGCSFHNNSCF